MTKYDELILISVISVMICVLFVYFLQYRYSFVFMDASSCSKNTLCSSVYDLEDSGIATEKSLCKNLVSCETIENQTREIDTDDFDIDSFSGNIRIPKLGCVTAGDYELCCTGDLITCFATQILLYNSFNLFSGFSFPFNSKLCRFLPSCFIENDSSPYLLFPIPKFSIEVYKDDFDELNNPGFEHDKLNKPIAAAFGALGATPLSQKQAGIYVIKLPKYKDLAYFSLQPYFFQTGSDEFVDKFSQDLPFASLTDSFNLNNLKNMSVPGDKIDKWFNEDGDLSLLTIATHNKKIAEKVYSILTQDIEDIKEKLKDKLPDNFPFEELDLPITCLPLPAGSTYGNSYDGLSTTDNPRTMLKETRTNKMVDENTPLFNWKTDTVGVVGRIATNIEGNPSFQDWLDGVDDQQNIFTLGIDDIITGDYSSNYEPFLLSDQNGMFVDGLWKGGYSIDPNNHNISSWKIQTKYPTGDLKLGTLDENGNLTANGAIDDRLEDITEDMAKLGYESLTDISINANPSPFFYYNKYIEDKQYDKKDSKWSQSGVDILQYNVAAYGDCRDTVYPTTDTICLGKYDILVLVANNFTEVNKDIAYNNLNLYDSESQTSLASWRGDQVNNGSGVYSLAVSRSDFTCPGNLTSKIDSVQFIPTGSHTNLAATTTTTFFAQSRCYLYKPTGTSPGLTDEQIRYVARVFTPCTDKRIYPSICYDYEADTCTKNPDKNKECSNDYYQRNIDDTDTQETISAALCSTLRLEKTTEKTEATVIYGMLISIFLVLIIFLIVNSINRSSATDTSKLKGLGSDILFYIVPIIIGLIMIFLAKNQIKVITDAPASNIKQASTQR